MKFLCMDNGQKIEHYFLHGKSKSNLLLNNLLLNQLYTKSIIKSII